MFSYFRIIAQQISATMAFWNVLHLVSAVGIFGALLTFTVLSDYVFDFLLYTQPSPYNERKNTAKRKEMPGFVLILAQPRTGSSFVGQLFNQNPNVFYLYEPLHSLALFERLNYIRKTDYKNLVASLLSNASSCHFNGFQDYFSFISHPGLSSPHYRLSSKSLSSPPLCKTFVQSFDNQSDFVSKCPPLVAESVSLVCSTKKFVTAKVLTHRLPKKVLEVLVEHFHSRKKQLKILQLIRDPRAVVWSMVKIGWIQRGTAGKRNAMFHLLGKDSTLNHSFTKQVQQVCDRMIKDVTLSSYLSSKLNDDQYMVIRYEELAKGTDAFASRIFDFTGVDFAPEVKDWLHRNTLHDKNEWSYSTATRNTTVTINSWRKSLSLIETSIIDRGCGYVIGKFGYVFIDNLDMLTNFAVNLMKPS